MRLFYRAFIARRDRRAEDDALEQLHKRYPDPRREPPTLITEDPNSAAVADFIRERAPDLTLARCKTLLREEVFDAPRLGTFVMHPGICPEYRNPHGCFWALANDDYDHVGMSLVRIDEGIDTGPVYGCYSYPYDAKHESHILIQQRVVLENLDAIRDRLLDVAAGKAIPLDTTGPAFRDLGATVVDQVPADPLEGPATRMKAVGLLYHDIVVPGEDDASGFPGAGPARYKLETDRFALQLEAIAAAGCAATTGREGLAASAPPQLFLTFDHGGSSAPAIGDLLAEHGWKGPSFIITDRIDTPAFVSTRDLLRRAKPGM